MKRLSVFVITLLTGVAAYAHPGHGHDGAPLMHYIASWWHVLPVVLALLLGYLLITKYRKAKA